jgi:hypothetical protein
LIPSWPDIETLKLTGMPGLIFSCRKGHVEVRGFRVRELRGLDLPVEVRIASRRLTR